MALRIEDYALIGDGRTAALVGRDGSIDWLCWPRFDSPACFAALLGTSDNGRWLIAPTDGAFQARRRYRPGTLVLETEFTTATGCAVVIDFMRPADSARAPRPSLPSGKTQPSRAPEGAGNLYSAATSRTSCY
jgi:GH15 family glucan-1,4-alpha-glucosidase